MNEDLTHNEEEFRSTAEEMKFELDIDTDQLWADIEPQLDPVTSRRRPFLWIWAGMAVLLIGSITYLGMMDEGMRGNAVPSPVVSQEVHKQTIDSRPTQLPQIQSSKTPNPAKIISEKSPLTTTNYPLDSKVTNEQEPVVDIVMVEGIENRAKSVAYKPTAQMPVAVASNQHEAEHRMEREANLYSLSKESVNQRQLGTNEPQDVEVKPSDSTDGSDKNTAIVEIQSERNTESPLTHLTTITSDLLASDVFKLHAPTIEILQDRRYSSYWRLAGGGHHTVDRSLVFVPDGAIDLEKETALIGVNAAVGYGRLYANGWRWSVGAAYQKNITRYTNQDQTRSQEIINGATELKIDDFGNLTTAQGDLTVTTISQKDITWHRSHDFVDVQMGVGKMVWQAGAFALSIDVYGSYNLWSRHTGYYFPEDGSYPIVKFESEGDHIYQDRGLSAGTRLSAEWNLGPIGLELSPFAERGFGSYIESTQYYQLKNSQYGVQLGIVYRP